MRLNVEVDDSEIMFESIKYTFSAFSEKNSQALIGMTLNEMQEILAGAVAYSKWCCSPSQTAELEILLAEWEDYVVGL